MSVFLIVMFGVYAAYEACQALFWRANAKTQVQQSLRMAIERMSRELRMAGYDPSGTGQVAVQNATSASLEFITDVDDNNASDLVKYDRDAVTGTLRRSVKAWTGAGWGPATVSVLATNANALSFQYFPSAAVPGLKRIEISIQTSMPVPTQPTQQFQMTTDVLLRNL